MQYEKWLFWGMEAILYIAFVSGDVFNPPWRGYNDILKYVALGICLVYALVLCNRKKQPGSRSGYQVGILAAAMCADYFLLFTERFVPGILLFAVVQGFYRSSFWEMRLEVQRMNSENDEKTPAYGTLGMFRKSGNAARIRSVAAMYLMGVLLSLATGIVGVVCIEMTVGEELVTICAAIFYACCLIQNVIMGVWLGLRAAGAAAKYGVSILWLTAAIVMLFLCDIHVALYNLHRMEIQSAALGLLSGYLSLSGTLMWVFYLPSQLCVVQSISRSCK